MQVMLDGDKLTDASSEVRVTVRVMADGVDVQPEDNVIQKTLQLEAQPHLRMHG